MAVQVLPVWVLAWFMVTALVCTWDALFILLRPHTLPGGKWHTLWSPYDLYIPVDQRYMDLNDGFVIGQSTLNLVEVFFNIVTLILHLGHSRHALPMALAVSVATFWKTVFYFLMFSAFVGGDKYRQGNTLLQEVFLLYLPNGIWLIVPFLVTLALWNNVLPAPSRPAPSLQTGSKRNSQSATKKEA